LRDDSTLAGHVYLTGAPVSAGAVDAHSATIHLTGGTLTTNATMTLATLELTGGAVAGPGELQINTGMSWSAGTMRGTGATTLASGATGIINPTGSSSASVTLDARKLDIRGTLTHASGTMRASGGATIDVSGTFDVNSEASYWGAAITYAAPTSATFTRTAAGRSTAMLAQFIIIRPSGSVRKPAGGGSSAVSGPVQNYGTIRTDTGEILFEGTNVPSQVPCVTSEIGGSIEAGPLSNGITWRAGKICLLPGVQVSGKVKIAGAEVHVWQLDAPAADVSMSSGRLTFNDPENASRIRSLSMTGGLQDGAGELVVSDGFTWTGGTMGGSGTTTVPAGASATIAPAGSPSAFVMLDTRTFSNEGATRLESGTILGNNGATIRNSGTFELASEASYWGSTIHSHAGSPSRFLNTGRLIKDAGTATSRVGMLSDNQGAVEVQTGELAFTAGGIPVTALPRDYQLCPTATNVERGSWSANSSTSATISYSAGCHTIDALVAGRFVVQGANVLAESMIGNTANVYATSGNLSILSSPLRSRVDTLYVSGSLTGPGDIDVCGSFTWQAGRLSGDGSTVVCPGATARINPPTGSLVLDGRRLEVDGVLSWDSGCISGIRGAMIYVGGVLEANSECPSGMSSGGGDEGSEPALVNDGLIRKTAGTGRSSISWGILHRGASHAQSGLLLMNGEELDPADGQMALPREVTPHGRELVDHATQRRLQRDVSLADIDEIVGQGNVVARTGKNDPPGRTTYGHPDYDVYVATEDNGFTVVTVYRPSPSQ
jgi:hypothetical protein